MSEEFAANGTADAVEVTLEDFHKKKRMLFRGRWKGRKNKNKNKRASIRRTSLSAEEAKLIEQLAQHTMATNVEGNIPDCLDFSDSLEAAQGTSLTSRLRGSRSSLPGNVKPAQSAGIRSRMRSSITGRRKSLPGFVAPGKGTSLRNKVLSSFSVKRTSLSGHSDVTQKTGIRNRLRSSMRSSISGARESLPGSSNHTQESGFRGKMRASLSRKRSSLPGNIAKTQNVRNRLRESISRKRASLSTAEHDFLKSLVDAKDIDEKVLINSAQVLETDDLYNPNYPKNDAHDTGISEAALLDLDATWHSIVDRSTHRVREDDSSGDESDDDLDATWHSQVDRSTHRIREDDSSEDEDGADLDVTWHSQIDRSTHRIREDDLKGNESGDELDATWHSQIDRSTHRIHEDDSSEDESGDDDKGAPVKESLKEVPKESPKEEHQDDSALRRQIWKGRPCSSFHEKIDARQMTLEAVKISNSREVHANADTFMDYFENLVGCAMKGQEQLTPVSSDISEEEGNHELKDNDPSTVSFLILGMSPNHEVHHVLSPPLMDAIAHNMPFAVKEDNFWLKYSLVRDGASMDVFLNYVRTSMHTIFAIETTNGEVFGSFTSTAWRDKGNNYYGSGESFLWRLRNSRRTTCKSFSERVDLESDIEVFKWSGKNRNVQLSNPRMLVVGGGEPDEDINHRLANAEVSDKSKDKEEWTFAVALNSDLSGGTSGKCATFDSPSLSKAGNIYEVSNVEVWSMTPLTNVAEAEKLELTRHFVFSSIVNDSSDKKPRE